MVDRLILLVVGLLLWGGHWMRWRIVPVLTDGHGELHRPLAYGYGCACILFGFVVWAHARSQATAMVNVWDAVRFLGWDVVAAGVGTMLPRAVRWIDESWAVRGDVADYEQAIERRRG